MLNKPPEEEERDQEGKEHPELEGILEQMEAQAEEETVRDLQKSTLLTIQAKVHAVVKEWENRFKVPLTDDARKHLEAHFGRFAQTCMNAAGGTLEGSRG